MNYLFIATHIGGGGGLLKRCLATNTSVYCRNGLHVYLHPSNLDDMKKEDTYARVAADRLVYNFQMAAPSVMGLSTFAYVVREPRAVLDHLHDAHGYSWDGALNYYRFRLRRLCEMARRTPRSFLFTFDDVVTGRALGLIQSKFGLKHPFVLKYEPAEEGYPAAPIGHLEIAQTSYERHLYYMRNLKLMEAVR